MQSSEKSKKIDRDQNINININNKERGNSSPMMTVFIFKSRLKTWGIHQLRYASQILSSPRKSMVEKRNSWSKPVTSSSTPPPRTNQHRTQKSYISRIIRILHHFRADDLAERLKNILDHLGGDMRLHITNVYFGLRWCCGTARGAARKMKSTDIHTHTQDSVKKKNMYENKQVKVSKPKWNTNITAHT